RAERGADLTRTLLQRLSSGQLAVEAECGGLPGWAVDAPDPAGLERELDDGLERQRVLLVEQTCFDCSPELAQLVPVLLVRRCREHGQRLGERQLPLGLRE